MNSSLKISFDPQNILLCCQSNKRQRKLQKNPRNSRDHFYSIREKIQSLSTNNCFEDDSSSLIIDQATQTQLDFTFFPTEIRFLSHQNKLPLKRKQKYSNTSVQCVIFYTLLFNHLHLQQYKEYLPEVAALSLQCYNLIKKSILSYDDILTKRKLSNFIFPQSTFILLENGTLSLKKRKEWLKSLIDKIDGSLIGELVELICKDNSTNDVLKENFVNTKRETQMNVQELANRFAIKVKYETNYKICSFGMRSSRICLFIKSSHQCQLFHLQKISCYQDK